MAEKGTAPHVIPFLRYDDARAALQWLARAFGFEEQAVYDGPDGAVAHAVMRWGTGMIMLGSSTRKADPLRMKTARELGAVNQGIYVHVPEVDAHYERAKAAGAEILLPVTDMEYGSREYAAREIEGESVVLRHLSAGGVVPRGQNRSRLCRDVLAFREGVGSFPA
jgi:uncharacterized glyoxalase superfamily protein PhnB